MAGPVLVFISYSHENATEVERLRGDLEQAGARIWIDHESLVPGTHDWDEAVRVGILAASFVVYAASVEARKSAYVRDEINLARKKGRDVIPFWVADEDWEDCAPLGWGSTQAIDGRGANYQIGLAKLLRRLGLEARSVIPKPVTPTPNQPRAPIPTQQAPEAAQSAPWPDDEGGRTIFRVEGDSMRQQAPLLGPGAHITVIFRQGVTVGQAQRLLAANAARPMRLIPREHGFLARVESGKEAEVCERLRQHPYVREVYPEYNEYGDPVGG